MAAVAMTHAAAVRGHMSISLAREPEGTTPHLTGMTSAKSSVCHAMSILSMGAFAMNTTALAVDGLDILRVQCCVA